MCDIQDGGSGCRLGNPIRGLGEVGVVVLERAAELLWSSWNGNEEPRSRSCDIEDVLDRKLQFIIVSRCGSLTYRTRRPALTHPTTNCGSCVALTKRVKGRS